MSKPPLTPFVFEAAQDDAWTARAAQRSGSRRFRAFEAEVCSTGRRGRSAGRVHVISLQDRFGVPGTAVEAEYSNDDAVHSIVTSAFASLRGPRWMRARGVFLGAASFRPGARLARLCFAPRCSAAAFACARGVRRGRSAARRRAAGGVPLGLLRRRWPGLRGPHGEREDREDREREQAVSASREPDGLRRAPGAHLPVAGRLARRLMP